MAFLTWLIGSSLGRKVALTGLAILGLAIVALRIYMAGRAAEQAKQAQARIDALRNRLSVDETITNLAPAERRRRLEEWATD